MLTKGKLLKVKLPALHILLYLESKLASSQSVVLVNQDSLCSDGKSISRGCRSHFDVLVLYVAILECHIRLLLFGVLFIHVLVFLFDCP